MNLVALFGSPHGKITREGYWLASLPLFVLSILPELFMTVDATLDMFVVSAVVFLVLLVPTCMLSIKRCHDRNRSGWFVLVGLIPLLGSLWILIDLGFLPGTRGTNRFGPDPLATGPDAGHGMIAPAR